MKILVLVKQVPDTYGERRLDPATGRLDRAGADRIVDEICERALEVALRHKDAAKDTTVVVATVGPEAAVDALRHCLAMGADRAVHVVDDALVGADALLTARALAAVVAEEEADLVVAGNESTDGRGGLVPAMIAELRGLPLLGGVAAVELAASGVRGVRTAETETATLAAELPAIVAVTEKAAEARFPNLRGTMSAERKPLRRVGAAELGVTGVESASVVLSVAERPPRAGGAILPDGPEAVERVLDLLRERSVI